MKTVKISDWVAALRSGDYEQITSTLKAEGPSYCCLGVICELADAFVQDDEVKFAYEDEYGATDFVSDGGELMGYTANSLEDAVDRSKFTDVTVWKSPKNFGSHLVDLNDHKHYSFQQIADEIEKYCDPNAEVVFWEEGDEL